MRQFCFTDSYLHPFGGSTRYRVSREYRLVPAPEGQMDGMLLCFGTSRYPVYGDWVVETIPAGQSEFVVTSSHSKAKEALFWAFRGAGMNAGDSDIAASHTKWIHRDQMTDPVPWEEEKPAPVRFPVHEIVLGFAFVLFMIAAVLWGVNLIR
jgi:hypothetical protein